MESTNTAPIQSPGRSTLGSALGAQELPSTDREAFEMAYQARVAIDRIKFAIKHAEQFAEACIHMREVGLQLLDALERLESLDRRFQIRSRIAADGIGTGLGRKG